MKRRGTLLIRIGELKTLLRRTFVFILFISAFLLILLSRVDSVVVDAANRVVMNVTGPVMQIVELPSRVIHRVYTYFMISVIFMKIIALCRLKISR